MSAAAVAASQFEARVAALSAERGETVTISEVAEIVGSLMHSLSGDLSAVQLRLSQELSALVDYINQARAEMRSLQPEEIRFRHIPQATDELDAVVEATASATGVILDSAEELEKLAATLPKKVAVKVTGIVTRIYEASNFQDLTGQRITKVVKTLRHIEERITVLAQALGHEAEANAARAGEDAAKDDTDLLNGPQLPQHANSQAEIDALLASFE
jgi:chemotaxis protein CheZ